MLIIQVINASKGVKGWKDVNLALLNEKTSDQANAAEGLALGYFIKQTMHAKLAKVEWHNKCIVDSNKLLLLATTENLLG